MPSDICSLSVGTWQDMQSLPWALCETASIAFVLLTSLPHLSTPVVPGSCSYVSRYSSIGVWQMAAQKLGCSCQTQKPAPAAIKTTTTTPTTIDHFFPFFLGAASSVVEPSVAGASVAASTLVSSSLMLSNPLSHDLVLHFRRLRYKVASISLPNGNTSTLPHAY